MLRGRYTAPAVVVALFLLAAGAVIVSGRIPHRVAYDQKLYHEEAIRVFAEQWPAVDVSDYLSATTPGFHLAMAAAVRHLGLGTAGLQVMCALIGAALLWTLAATVPRTGLRGVAILLPFAASMYVFASGAWVLPDNAAWLGVLVILLMALRDHSTPRWILVMGIALAGLVLIRQIHIWLAGVIMVAAVLGVGGHRPLRSHRGELGFIARACLAGIACLPAVLILVWCFGLWGGLVPPTFQFQYRAVNAAGPAFVLAVIGAISVFYVGYLVPIVRRTDGFVWFAVVAGIVGLVLGVIPRTTAGADADFAAGRRTGLWDVAGAFHTRLHVPDLFGHTSPVMLTLCVLGSVCVAGWLMVWSPRQRLLWMVAIAGYAAAFAAGGELWQRYAEPFALMFVVLSALRTEGPKPERTTGWGVTEDGDEFRYGEVCYPLGPVFAAAGPLVLALAFAALTVRDLRKADTGRVTDPPPAAETSGPGEPPPKADSPWSRYMIGHQRHPAFRPKP